ncbi:hypothetical protein L6R52_18895 [Myxococcota bacterium]|nr:hypothetical protein [Myxococcota bacterium]
MGPRAVYTILTALVASAPSTARAEDWVWESDDADVRASANVRFSSRFDVWFATFDRPARACDPDATPVIAPPFAGGPIGSRETTGGCSGGLSDELGFGTGVTVAFRLFDPLYVTAGLDVVYTTPDDGRYKNQIVVPVPFGLLVTYHPWMFRPVLHLTITPMLYVTDDARDYTLGTDVGFAWRVLDWGDLSLTAGYRSATTVDLVQLEVALHPAP